MTNYILWDWNGTLLDDVAITMKSVNFLLKKYNIPQIKNRTEYQNKFFFPIENYYETLGFDFSKTPYTQLAQEFVAIYCSLLPDCHLNPQAKNILDFFHKKNYQQIIISASREDKLVQQVQSHKIEHYFQQILGISNIYAESKIHIAQKWQEQNNIDSKNILFIGDTFHDYEVAKKLNCSCLLYQHGHQFVQEKKAPDATFISSLMDAALVF